MYVSKIRMQNFRCYTDFTMHFSSGVTVIVAENGKGKTAILDGLAINMAPYLAAFPGIKGRNFQPNDVRMVMDVPSNKEELQIRRMKYLLPVVLETEVKADDGKAYSWKRELKTVKGKTSSASAKFVSDYGKRIADALNQPGDQDIILPVIGYYGTSRMWNDSSLLKRKNVDLSRSSGYTECLEPSGSYNTFAQWFRYATESALEYDRIIAEKNLKTKNPYRELLNAIKKAIVTCISSMGWTDLKYSFAAQNLLICHPKMGELPLEAMSDGQHGSGYSLPHGPPQSGHGGRRYPENFRRNPDRRGGYAPASFLAADRCQRFCQGVSESSVHCDDPQPTGADKCACGKYPYPALG